MIENTNPNVPLAEGLHAGTGKLEALKNFLKMPVGKDFKVDTYLTDFYGYNCTWNWHGFLQKCDDSRSAIQPSAPVQHPIISTTDDQTWQLVQAGKEKRQQLLNSPTRYQSIDDREDSSVISGVAIPGPTRALARASTYLALASKTDKNHVIIC